MPNEVPFDVWDGEDLDTAEVIAATSVEDVAMHLDPDSLVVADGEQPWSDLTDDRDTPVPDDGLVRYFDDEQPEAAGAAPPDVDEPEPDLEDLLERQHYSFRQKG